MTNSKNAKYQATITVMPDYGCECLWIKQLTPLQSTGDVVADYNVSIRESLSEALESDFAHWQAEFETAEMDVGAGILLLDWPDYHQRGLALAKRLRAELSDDIGVFYQKPYEDPNEQFEEIKELLHDCVIALQPKARRLRSGRRVPDWLPEQILSGGQTGVDRAALDWAISERIPHCGCCPKGRKATDGVLSLKYQLVETKSGRYRKRTEKNVLESDATLIITEGILVGGSKLTFELCQDHHKPCCVVNLSDLMISGAAEAIRRWLMGEKIKRLNVAGPSESRNQQIYRFAFAVLDALIPLVECQNEV